jgi:hypothetical protein
MQNTRLTTLIDTGLGRLSQWLRNPWRKTSLLLISLLAGNFLATTIATVAGQRADLDVVVAALLVLMAEIISWLIYRGDRRRRDTQDRASSTAVNPLFLDLLNGIKLGLMYGLFVEAFKLGS